MREERLRRLHSEFLDSGWYSALTKINNRRQFRAKRRFDCGQDWQRNPLTVFSSWRTSKVNLPVNPCRNTCSLVTLRARSPAVGIGARLEDTLSGRGSWWTWESRGKKSLEGESQCQMTLASQGQPDATCLETAAWQHEIVFCTGYLQFVEFISLRK